MRPGWVRLAVAGALLTIMCFPVTVAARTLGNGVSIDQELVDSNGDPSILAGGIPDFYAPLEWQRCLAGAMGCELLPFSGNVMAPGATPVGTTFKVNVAGQGEVLTSREWQGRLSVSIPASISGEPIVGGVVRGQPAIWNGGWLPARDTVTVFACRAQTSETCDVVTGSWQPGTESMDKPLAPKYEGWLLYAESTHLMGDEIFPASLLPMTRPNPLETPRITRSVSAANGPIKRDARYRIRVLRFARLSRRRASLATARCAAGCMFRARINVHPASPTRVKPGRTRTIAKNFDSDGVLRIDRKLVKRARFIRVTVYDRGVHVGGGVTRLPRR